MVKIVSTMIRFIEKEKKPHPSLPSCAGRPCARGHLRANRQVKSRRRRQRSIQHLPEGWKIYLKGKKKENHALVVVIMKLLCVCVSVQLVQLCDAARVGRRGVGSRGSWWRRSTGPSSSLLFFFFFFKVLLLLTRPFKVT